jgi:hypothetical protein
MRRSDIVCSKSEPLSIVPRFGKVPENLSETASGERGDVLHDDDEGSNRANDARELAPETATLASKASALP